MTDGGPTHAAELFAEPGLRLRIRRRDQHAWEDLYGAYGVRLRQLAHRILPSRLDPEAVAQQAWVQGISKASRYDVSRHPYPWLSKICVNLCISILRRERTRSRFLQDAHNRERGAALFNRGAGHGETQARVRKGVTALPRPLQQVLYLRYACELPTPEIAEVLGLSEAATRKRISRAYEKLRDDLTPMDPKAVDAKGDGPGAVR